jgi:hypothetical protein
MDERHMDWALQAEKLQLQLENRRTPPTNVPLRMAALREEIRVVEQLIRSYRQLFGNEQWPMGFAKAQYRYVCGLAVNPGYLSPLNLQCAFPRCWPATTSRSPETGHYGDFAGRPATDPMFISGIRP